MDPSWSDLALKYPMICPGLHTSAKGLELQQKLHLEKYMNLIKRMGGNPLSTLVVAGCSC